MLTKAQKKVFARKISHNKSLADIYKEDGNMVKSIRYTDIAAALEALLVALLAEEKHNVELP